MSLESIFALDRS